MGKNIKTVKKEKRKPRKWLWEGLLQESSVNILVGQQSRGKSMLATGLIKEMLKSRGGQTYLGRGVHPAKILYISTEMQEDMLVQRLADVGVDGRMKNINKRLFFYYNTQPTFADIEREIAECEPDLVIVDIFGALFNGENLDINSYDDLNRVVSKLKSFNKAFLLVHHMNKLNKSMGSTGTLSAMDTRLEMLETDRDFDENYNVIIYQTIHAYGKAIQDQYINVAFKYPEFTLAETEEAAELDKPLSRLVEVVILAAANKNGDTYLEGTYQEIAAQARMVEKYQFNPKRLGALLRMNEDTLKQNNIYFETKRKTKGYTVKIWYDPAGSEEPVKYFEEDNDDETIDLSFADDLYFSFDAAGNLIEEKK